MRAQRGVVGDVARLLESADEIARPENGLQHRRGIAGIGAQIAVAQIGGGEECRAAGQVKDDVAARPRVIARWPEYQRAAGRGGRLREIVDRHLERADVTAGVPDLSLRHRKVGPSRWSDRRRGLDQYRDVQMVLEQLACLDRGLVAAADEDDAAALQVDQRHRRRGLGRGRQQRRHFRPRLRRFTGPSRGLAEVDELNWRCASTFRGRIGKQRRLLRASDRQRRVACRDCPEPIELGAAQLGRAHKFAAAPAMDRANVERHGVVA